MSSLTEPPRGPILWLALQPTPSLFQPLRPGDRIGVCAPAGPVDAAAFSRGLDVLRSFGWPLLVNDQVHARQRYLAGPDGLRSATLHAFLRDPSIRAIVCARGGYGSLRLLESIDVAALRADPKPLVGFSDITALHALWATAGVASIHGPVVTQLGGQPAESIARLKCALAGDALAPHTGLATITPGRASGILRGGNLATLASLTGTPWMPKLSGAILLLEDIGERPYRLDRFVTQLRTARALDGIVGVVLGDFTDCAESAKGTEPAYTALDILSEALAPLGVPVAAGAPIGHGALNLAVPLGRLVTLDADAGTLSFEATA